jgi:hypothetical protein
MPGMVVGICTLMFMGIVFHFLQEDNPLAMFSSVADQLRSFNKWVSEAFGFSETWLVRFEIGALAAFGFTLMQIGEWVGAITCWVLLISA